MLSHIKRLPQIIDFYQNPENPDINGFRINSYFVGNKGAPFHPTPLLNYYTVFTYMFSSKIKEQKTDFLERHVM